MNLMLAIAILVMAGGLGCSRRQEPLNLMNRADFASLKGLCLEATTNLFVSMDEKQSLAYLSPTGESPGVFSPGERIEAAGARIFIEEFVAQSGFDGMNFYCFGKLESGDGKSSVKAMINNFFDRDWFFKATEAAAENATATNISASRPPIDYSFLRVCPEAKQLAVPPPLTKKARPAS